MLKELWKKWGIVWCIWTLVGLFFMSQVYSLSVNWNRQFYPYESFVSEFTYCYTWILGTRMVLWFARWCPIERPYFFRRVVYHLLASLVLAAFTHGVHSLTVNRLILNFSFTSELNFIFINCHLGILIYWVIVLIHHSFEFSRKYQEEKLQGAELEAQLVQAQLQALKMQLNPHFLFNTLNSISTLLLTNPEAAHKMVARLGDFLRLTLLNNGNQEVSLQQELEFLKCYLEIEHTRFRDRLSVKLDIDPATRDALVPNLFLQPIVENSICHGIAPRVDPGSIQIETERKGDRLMLRIKDDGPGIQFGNSTTPQFKEGIGLSNTRARLKRLYGDSFQFNLTNVPEGGLLVTLEIPFQTNSQFNARTSKTDPSLEGFEKETLSLLLKR